MAAGTKRKRNSAKDQLLVILDMNGVLLVRPKGGSKWATFRPYLQEFIDTLWENYPRLNVGVWSSMMPHNLHPLVEEVFGTRCKDLAFVYDQSWCTATRAEGLNKPLLRKDLKWFRQTDWYSHYAANRILLVDDDPIKCTENRQGTAVHPLTFEGDMSDTELRRLGSYLSTLAQSDCSSVPEFTMQYPYETFEQEAVPLTPPCLKRARSNGSDADSDVPYSAGDDIEAYWPEDDSWIPAQIIEVVWDGSLRVHWDGAESIVPPEYVRYP